MRSEIRSLTGLRGVAAMLVMAGHFTEGVVPSGPLGNILNNSYLAVYLFFILSGFVLAMVYLDGDSETSGRMRFGRFLGHRLARIYPLYAMTTLVSFALARMSVPIYGDPAASAPALASNLLMTQSWGWPSDSLNGPGWSISTEWAANLLFPAFVLTVIRPSWWVSAILVLIFVAALVWSEHASPTEFWGTPIILHQGWLRIPQTITACPVEFALGMYCWRIWKSGHGESILKTEAVSLMAVLGLGICMVTKISDLWFVGLSCLLVISLAYGTSSAARALASPVVHRLGLLSFSIYMIHAPMISLVPGVLTLLNGVHIPHARSMAMLLVMMTTVGLAQLSYMFIEQPSRRLLRQAFRLLAPAPTQSSQGAIRSRPSISS